MISYPKLLFTQSEDENGSIISGLVKCNDVIVLVVDYLFRNFIYYDKTVGFTLEHMIKDSGYKVNNNKGKSVDKFKSALLLLYSSKLINCTSDIVGLKVNEFIKVENLMLSDYEFFQCEEYIKDKLLNYFPRRIDGLKLLTYYYYICAKMFRTNSPINGYYLNCSFASHTCTNETGISKSSIFKFNKILKDLELIDYDNIGMLIDPNGNKINGVNYYVLTTWYNSDKKIFEKYDYKLHLNEGLKYSKNTYLNNGYKIIN